MTSVLTDRRFGVNSGAAVKVPCRAATTAAITLSGLQTVDGVVLAAADRVLVKNQVSGVDNGIYDVATGSWTRSVDFDGSYDVKCGTFVRINEGTASALTAYRLTTSDPITIGSTALTFTLDLAQSSAAALALTGGSALVGNPASNVSSVTTTAAQLAALTAEVAGTGTIASATTCDIGSVANAMMTVTGTVTITAFGDTLKLGTTRILQIVSSGLTITASTNMVLSAGTVAGAARNYLSVAGDTLVVTCTGTNAGHNVYFVNITQKLGTAIQENSFVIQKQNFSFIPGVNTLGGLSAHPNTAVDVTNCGVIALSTNGDLNQVGQRTARVLRLTNASSQGNTIPNAAGAVHSDIDVNVSPTVVGGIITHGGLDTGVLAINTHYYLYCVSDGSNWAYVWSTSVQFPNTAAFPNYIYAAMCGWNHSNGAGSFWQYQKVNSTYTIVNSGNNYPTIASGSNAGVPTAASLATMVSPQAYRVHLNLKSATLSTTVSVAGNNTAPVAYSIAQSTAPVPQRAYVSLGLESAFVYYGSNDAAGELRLFGFEDVV